MEVAVGSDNDQRIRMLENPMKFDFQLSHNTLAVLQTEAVLLIR